MIEILKKIGLPATVAAAVAALVVTVPLLFKIDERYAKDEDVQKYIKKLEKKIEKQNNELAQLAGFQQAMVMLIQQGRVPTAPPAPGLARGPASVDPVVVEKPKNWSEINEALSKQQSRLKKTD